MEHNVRTEIFLWWKELRGLIFLMQESKRKKTLEMTRLKLRFTGSLISQDLHDHFFFKLILKTSHVRNF